MVKKFMTWFHIPLSNGQGSLRKAAAAQDGAAYCVEIEGDAMLRLP
jgi:hypothetical protein